MHIKDVVNHRKLNTTTNNNKSNNKTSSDQDKMNHNNRTNHNSNLLLLNQDDERQNDSRPISLSPTPLFDIQDFEIQDPTNDNNTQTLFETFDWSQSYRSLSANQQQNITSPLLQSKNTSNNIHHIDQSNNPYTRLTSTSSATNFNSSNPPTITSKLLSRCHQFISPMLDWIKSKHNIIANWPIFNSKFVQKGSQWIIIVLIAIAIGIVSLGVNKSQEWLIDLRLGYCEPAFFSSERKCAKFIKWSNNYFVSNMIYCVFSVIFASFACWLCFYFNAKWAKGSGIAEIKTILGNFKNDDILSFKTLVIKCTALIFSVSSGLGIGREGPAVHFSACLGNCFSKLLRVYRYDFTLHSQLLSASISAGLAAAFGGIPLSGVLFSFEELATYFPKETLLQCFVCALVASLTVHQNGKNGLLSVSDKLTWSYIELIPFALIGIFAGLSGALFIRVNMWVCKFRRYSVINRHLILECALVALVSSIVKFQSVLTRGNFEEVLETLYVNCSKDPNSAHLDATAQYLCDQSHVFETCVLLIYGSILTWTLAVYSISLNLPAGVLIPMIVSGSFFGRASGLIFQSFQERTSIMPSHFFDSCTKDPSVNCIQPGIYAIIGGISLLGGVSRLTITLAVIMFELTPNGLTYILPLMTSLLFAKTIGDMFGHESLYEKQIQFLNYPYLDHNTHVSSSLTVADVMTKTEQLISLCFDTIYTVSDLKTHINVLNNLRLTGSPIIDSNQAVVGYVTKNQLVYAIKNWTKSLVYLSVNDESSISNITSPSTNSKLKSRAFHSSNADHHHHQQQSQTDLTQQFKQEIIISDNSFAGFIPLSDELISQSIDAGNTHAIDLSKCLVSHTQPVQVNESMSLARLHDIFIKLGLRFVLVVNHGQLCGFVSKKDILNSLRKPPN